MAMTVLFLFLGGCQKDETKKEGSKGITLNEFLVKKGDPIFYQFFSDDYITDQNEALRKLKNRSLNPLIDTFKTDLLSIDTSGKFIQFLVDKEGYPIWDFYKYYLSESGNKHIVFIPVAKITSKQITGLFIGIKDIESTSKFEIKYFSTEYFNEIISSNIFTSLDIVTISHYIIFNQQIFDYNNEDFMDWLILNLDDFNQSTTEPRCQVITICWDPPLYTIIGPKVVSNRQQECRTFTFCDGGLYNGSDPPGGFIGGPILGGDGTWVDSDGDGVPDRGLPGGVDDGTGYPGAGAGNTENHPDFLAELAKELGISVECLNKLDKVAKMTLTQIKANQVYIDPCDATKNSNGILGEVIQTLCTTTTDKVTSDMLKNSLNDSGYVTQQELDEAEEIFTLFGITDESDKIRFISGNPCDEEQWTMPPIDWATSSCDQIFGQLIKAIQGQYLFVHCFGGNPGDFDLSRYFTNMGNSKTCGESKYTTPDGIIIKGSFDLNFTLSANPPHKKYIINGFLQNQGVVYGSGKPLESYIMFGPNSNAPLLSFGIPLDSDAAFIKFINRPCPPK
jgi:hypothetical protein